MLLTWHVDYWDRLGWKDPFGSAEASARQSRYAKAREQRTRWTPQFVVDGEIVPNRESRGIPERVERAHDAETPVVIEARAVARESRIDVSVRLRETREDWDPKATLTVTTVLVRREATTKVPSGENADRSLVESYVALVAGKPARLADALGEDGVSSVFEIPEGLTAGDLSITVLVESPDDMRPIECASIPVEKSPAKPIPEER